jgi:hypothetical protein
MIYLLMIENWPDDRRRRAWRRVPAGTDQNG